MHVIGADQRQTQIPGDRLQSGVHGLLFVDALVLHLEKEVFRAKDVPEGGGRFTRLAGLFGTQTGRHLALEATAESDQAFGVLGEQFLVDPRFVVEALRIAGRDQLDQVVIPSQILAQQDQMIVGLAGSAAAGMTTSGGDIDLAAENRFDVALARLIVKDDAGKQITVLGDGQRGRSGLLGVVQQLADPAGAVQ